MFILADDLGYGDVGCYGQKWIRTPNIDQLAKEGMRFTQYYAGSSVCAPSRAVLMTGQHTGHTYIRGNYDYETEGNLPIPDSTITLPEVLKKAGYRTAMIGKWGLGGPGSTGGPNRQGFDYSLGYLDQRKAHDYYIPYLWENEKKYPLEKNRDGNRNTYSHDVFAEAALTFIRETKNHPFFLYLPFTIPHGKLEVPTDAPYSLEKWSQPQKNYAAMITRLDGDIGRIVALLNELGIDQNTLIVFTSDNGPVKAVADQFDSNGPFRGYKLDLYEGGIREPMIVRWPGRIKAGSENHEIAAAWDVLPTFCELAGATTPKAIDGISFLPTLLGKPQPKSHSNLYWEFFEINYNWNKPDNKFPRIYLDKQAARMGDWKAVRADLLTKPDAPLELYNLKDDVGETKNVAAAHPDVVLQMTELLRTSRREGDFFKANPNQLLK
ncbi:hypothetical protein EHT25_05610 [Larkinella rosea]|uniref:Sulfatase N-terminal domain-containing protein n=1 Tax=Larkinella rosea TaxID=2025312 RepID=A0A3P1C4B3_9BACT|nr:hypothetical protein EHT25_05610 [Larkinella rosea]